jgi:hypothetical protein
MNTAKTLIEAVQLGSPKHLKNTIKHVTRDMRVHADIYKALSSGLRETGLTALHVAAKLYSIETNRERAEKYNAMCRILLESGAEPYSMCRIGGETFTALQVAGRNAPPALIAHIRTLAERYELGDDLAARARRANMKISTLKSALRGYGSIYTSYSYGSSNGALATVSHA